MRERRIGDQRTSSGRRRAHNRGAVLISSYLLLSLVLVYSSAMTMQTLTRQVSTDALLNRCRALDLAWAATEELREDLFRYIQTYISGPTGDATAMVNWLDGLPAGKTTFDQAKLDAVAPGATGLGTADSHRAVALSGGAGEAWITAVGPTPLNEMWARNVTIESMATVNGITRRMRSTFRVSLGASSIFRYAYFVNNYGWFDLAAEINGDVRANGNLRFAGDMSKLWVQGDLYASLNPNLTDPVTNDPATGLITGDPTQKSDWTSYWTYKTGLTSLRARPAQLLTHPNQPAIGGTPTKLPAGFGWDSEYVDPNTGVQGEQRKFTAQPVHDMPFIGDLNLYKTMADNQARSVTLTNDDGDGKGSYLKIKSGAYKIQIDEVYKGPNGIAGDADDKQPLVLIGTASDPIEIGGPVVIPGDVIIRGVVKGRGTIYSGRNVHVVGNVTPVTPPEYPALERNATTGVVREYNATNLDKPESNLGVVCSGAGHVGEYYPPAATPPSDCM